MRGFSAALLRRPASSDAARLARVTVPPARWRRLRMWQRFFLSQVTVFTLLMLILVAVQYASLTDRTRQEFGERALMLSRTIANMPTLRTYFIRPDVPLRIDPLLRQMQADIGADFLVVGGRLGMRYAHPFPPALAQRISRSGPDDVLASGDPVEVGVQQFREFIWGKAEVRGAANEVIGLVSTGFLLPTVQAIVWRVSLGLLPWYGFGLLFALLSSLYLSARLRRDLFDLEPDQISGLVSQHHAVLTALQDGVLVLEQDRVVLANQCALDYMGVASIAGLPCLPTLWPELSALLQREARPSFREAPGNWRQQPVLISGYRLPNAQQVVVFRERAEAVRLAEELTHAREYVELLRSQTHEFTNRLHTIAGLMQIGRPELALQVIQREAGQAQQISDRVSGIVPPRLAALLAGKIARARELGVDLQIDPASALEDHWPGGVIDTLILAVGNLVENAFDAVRGQNAPQISVMIGEDAEGVQLEVRDGGPGLTPPHLPHPGFSTKGPGRGQGLALIHQHLLPYHGQLEYFRAAEESVFILSIPAAPELGL
ncbi:PAS domain-containing protein [Deinococcus detaillensis]|uniref:PAS domain-containing protein n=1 Tax=Deinococcus detaillensis TaxID=2592048 RepID=A0A553UK52_9DEIO|nr:ATP-binding protein [Deinococcus detaillensis]TSA80582.1 PAS domain-containing protein [Deinococcus detaillensis]